MRRPMFFLAAPLLAVPALAQPPASAAPARGADCIVRMNATPTSWMITGFDPYDGTVPEGTYSVTFVNDGGAECRFAPIFQIDQPPFGLSKGHGKPIGYALLNLTDSQDVTPRAGRSVRTPSQRELVLAPNESRSLLYKLVADPDDIRDSGTFTQDVTLEALDQNFRSLGGTRLVLGIDVLPSARIGLSGAYTMNDGHAVVDLGELRPGIAPVPLQLRVNSTGQYDLTVSSANSGRLRLGASDWFIPYSVAIGGNTVNLAGSGMVTGPNGTGFRRDSLPIHFFIGDVGGRRAGTYSDVVSISVTAR
ncbi:MAG: hypothetical protein U0S50_16250 [Sphingopyxis sp.]|uniref:hypothetical protein n=1 Tax=Sphingopyxis sp. TaxID=1908224 RepID=UPI002ABA374F|nr:hypothetical protein [Sphingopyxis sp.]MDZ3833346.1 hypothetical protein [Sphingopyxis sp.]